MIFDLQLLARARQRLGVRRQVERGAALERQTNTQSGVTATAVQDDKRIARSNIEHSTPNIE